MYFYSGVNVNLLTVPYHFDHEWPNFLSINKGKKGLRRKSPSTTSNCDRHHPHKCGTLSRLSPLVPEKKNGSLTTVCKWLCGDLRTCVLLMYHKIFKGDYQNFLCLLSLFILRDRIEVNKVWNTHTPAPTPLTFG